MVIWKLSRGRKDTLHAYDLTLAPRPGQKFPSLCSRQEYTLASTYNDEGTRCRVCERRARKEAASGSLLGDVDGL